MKRGDFVTHPQNGNELGGVVEVGEMRGEPVMRVAPLDHRQKISAWIAVAGWSDARTPARCPSPSWRLSFLRAALASPTSSTPLRKRVTKPNFPDRAVV